jgi:hypothetical protein
VRHIDLWQAPDTNLDPDIAFRPSPMWRACCVAFLGVALVRRSRFAAPLSGYRLSAGEPLSAFAARLTAPIWRDEIQQRNWICRTGAAIVTAAVVTAAVVTAVVAAGERTPARVETAASVKTAAAGPDSARMTAAPAPREHGRSSDGNNHGDRCN